MLGSLVYIGLDVAFNVILWILVKTTGSVYNGFGYAYHYLKDVEDNNQGTVVNVTTRNLNTGEITVDNNLDSIELDVESITNSLSKKDINIILNRLNQQTKLLNELMEHKRYYSH